jgi:hypothetical protein
MNASNKLDTCVYNILVKEDIINGVIFRHIIYSRNSEGDVRSLLQETMPEFANKG